MNNEEFLAEMKRRREAAAAGQTPKEQNEYSYIDTSSKHPAVSPQIETPETGIIGFLIKRGIAKNAGQANLILIGVFVVVVAIIAWLDWPKGSAPATSTGTPSAVSRLGLPGAPNTPPTTPTAQ